MAIRESLAAADPKNERPKGSLASAYTRLSWTVAKSGDLTGALDYRQKALAIYESLAAAEPTPDVASTNYDIGSLYEQLATDSKRPIPERLEHWKVARSYHQRCFNNWVELRNRGQLKGPETGFPEIVAKNIARCDSEMEKLK